MRTASSPHLRTNHAKVAADVQTVVPGTELGLSFQRMARVPTRNPNTVRGSRQHPVELQILADLSVPVLASARSPARIPPCAGQPLRPAALTCAGQPFLSEFTEVARVSGALHTPRASAVSDTSVMAAARGFYSANGGCHGAQSPSLPRLRVQRLRAGFSSSQAVASHTGGSHA